MEIKIMKRVLQANIDKARHIRGVLNDNNIFMANLISAPGAGKTSILENTIGRLKDKFKIAVIEGDIASDNDAVRLKKFDIPIVLINTDGSCHLDSMSIERALLEFDLTNVDVIFVENVGNLVCPAEFDIGEDIKIAVSSVTEGDDKPVKYPLLYREADLLILNKMDLIAHTNFSKADFISNVKKLNGELPIIEMACVNSHGNDDWTCWLEKFINKKLA